MLKLEFSFREAGKISLEDFAQALADFECRSRRVCTPVRSAGSRESSPKHSKRGRFCAHTHGGPKNSKGCRRWASVSHFISDAPALPKRGQLMPGETRKKRNRLRACSMYDQALRKLSPPQLPIANFRCHVRVHVRPRTSYALQPQRSMYTGISARNRPAQLPDQSS